MYSLLNVDGCVWLEERGCGGGGGGGSMRDSDKRWGCGVGGWVRRQT